MGIACLFSHKWNGCKCSRCGKVRDEQHDWDGLNCSRCGKKCDIKEVEDRTFLLNLAENSDDYRLCYEAYRQLNIIPKNYSLCNFADLLKSVKGSNKAAFISYVIKEKLGDTVGSVKITVDDIEALYSDNQTKILSEIANSRVLNLYGYKRELVKLAYERAILSCEKSGGHNFDINHICSICGVAECKITGNHYFGNACVCKVCRLEGTHEWKLIDTEEKKETPTIYGFNIYTYRCTKCGEQRKENSEVRFKD